MIHSYLCRYRCISLYIYNVCSNHINEKNEKYYTIILMYMGENDKI